MPQPKKAEESAILPDERTVGFGLIRVGGRFVEKSKAGSARWDRFASLLHQAYLSRGAQTKPSLDE